MTQFKRKSLPKQFKACQNLPSGSQNLTSKLLHSLIFGRKESKFSLEKRKWFGGTAEQPSLGLSSYNHFNILINFFMLLPFHLLISHCSNDNSFLKLMFLRSGNSDLAVQQASVFEENI